MAFASLGGNALGLMHKEDCLLSRHTCYSESSGIVLEKRGAESGGNSKEDAGIFFLNDSSFSCYTYVKMISHVEGTALCTDSGRLFLTYKAELQPWNHRLVAES